MQLVPLSPHKGMHGDKVLVFQAVFYHLSLLFIPHYLFHDLVFLYYSGSLSSDLL